MMRPGRVGPLDDPDDDDPGEEPRPPGLGAVLAIAFLTTVVTTLAEKGIEWAVEELKTRKKQRKQRRR